MDKALGPKVGAIKASQIRGAPDYPVQNLYPCHMTEGIIWSVDPTLLLSVGILFGMSGVVSYAPAMVTRMRIKSFRVWCHIDAFDEATRFKLRLTYIGKDGSPKEQVSASLAARMDRFAFDIPLDHISRDGWFTCSLKVHLLSPMVDEERQAAIAQGQEEPMQPVLLRGGWLEIKG